MKYGAMINRKTHTRTVLSIADTVRIGDHIDGVCVQNIFDTAEHAQEYHDEIESEGEPKACREPREVPSSDCSCPL